MVERRKASEAPKEVWIEWSVLPDGSDPMIEHEHLKDPKDSQALRYVLDDPKAKL